MVGGQTITSCPICGEVCSDTTLRHKCSKIPEQLKPLEKQYVGKRVLIVKKGHPHYQSVGTVDRIELAGAIGKWGFVVNYDNGLSGFIFDGSEWRVLDEKA